MLLGCGSVSYVTGTEITILLYYKNSSLRNGDVSYVIGGVFFESDIIILLLKNVSYYVIGGVGPFTQSTIWQSCQM